MRSKEIFRSYDKIRVFLFKFNFLILKLHMYDQDLTQIQSKIKVFESRLDYTWPNLIQIIFWIKNFSCDSNSIYFVLLLDWI